MVAGLVFAASFLAVFISRYERLYNPYAIVPDSTAVIYLYHDENVDSVNQIMKQVGLRFNTNRFDWAAGIFGWNHFKQGRYVIRHNYSYRHFLRKLSLGIQDPVRVTILPGLTEKDFTRDVASHFIFPDSALWNTMHDSTVIDDLGVKQVDIMGRMLPDTYQFYWNSTPEQFLKRLLNEFNEKVIQPYSQRMQSLGMTPDKIITLASIIEWEAKKDSEKAIISGLYWNRLKRGMLLQADPTVNFAIGQRRRLLYADYQVKSPYNTYRHKGLPPGPITNPSLSSIKAALYPDDNNYLYMVANPNGTHDFSKTFAEHKKKSEAWRRWLNKQYRIKRQREADSARTARK